VGFLTTTYLSPPVAEEKEGKRKEGKRRVASAVRSTISLEGGGGDSSVHGLQDHPLRKREGKGKGGGEVRRADLRA